MNNQAKRAALWDMDGTLVDTAELHFNAWKRLFDDDLGKPFTRDDFAATFGMRNPEIFAKLCGPDAFSPERMAWLGDQKEIYYRKAAEEKGVELLPGAQDLLSGLEQAGFKQAVGSSAPRANLDLILRLTGAARFFDTLVTAEDTQRGKPDPQVFLVAAERVGVEPAKCVVLEDAPAGVQAARAGGMKCIAVTFVGHHPDDKLQQAGADLVVKCLTAVSVQGVEKLIG